MSRKSEIMYFGSSSSSSSAKIPKRHAHSFNYLSCRKCFMEKGQLIYISSKDFAEIRPQTLEIERHTFSMDNVDLNDHSLSCKKCSSVLGSYRLCIRALGRGYKPVILYTNQVLYIDVAKDYIIDLYRTTFTEGKPDIILAKYSEYENLDGFFCKACFNSDDSSKNAIAYDAEENLMRINEHCVDVKHVTDMIRFVERPLLEFDPNVCWEEMFCLTCGSRLGRFYNQSRDGIRYSLDCNQILYRRHGVYCDPRDHTDILDIPVK